jgi:flagellar protein FlgJ
MLPSTNSQTDLAVDLSSLNRLRSMSQHDKRGALDQAAKQFEALFIHQLLKSARSASFGDPLFGSHQMDTYKDMFDQQLALSMAQSGETGIGDLLVKQLQGSLGVDAASKDQAAKNGDTDSIQPLRRFLGAVKPIQVPSEIKTKDSVVETPANASKTSEASQASFSTPSEFIEKLRPHAEEAAAKLGVNPQVLLAQAALETGWGKYISRDSQGKSSFNLFNIKAGPDWGGKTLEMNSMEFVNGGFVKQNSTFRAYDGFAQSFEDYVDFLKSNPRYGDAISRANNDAAFTKALQGAGYATDPDYSRKITRVLKSPAMAEAFGKLKFSQSGSLTQRDG